MSFNELADEVHSIAKEKGWWDTPREMGTLLMLIVSELSEGMEADRQGLNDDKLPQRPGLHVELADAVIRILDICAHEKIDLDSIVLEKIAYNKMRSHRHGGKKY